MLQLSNYRLLQFLMVLVLMTSCYDEEVDQTLEEIRGVNPIITSFKPEAADVKELVTVYGENLNFVDSVYIGGVLSPIYRRINSNELVLQVAPQAKSGKVRVLTAAKKEGISEATLQINYPVPAVQPELSEIKDELLANNVVVLGGSKLNVIDKVFFGEKAATIIYQRAASIAVLVPLFPNDQVVDISYSYFTPVGSEKVAVKSGVQIITPSPRVSNWVPLLIKGKTYTLEGQNLNMVEKVFVGATEATITDKQAVSLSFVAPGGTTAKTSLKLQYTNNGEQQVLERPVAYIASNVETYFDFEDRSLAAVTVGKSANTLSSAINGTVEQPAFPAGNAYYHANMFDSKGDAGGSSITYIRFDKQANNSWKTMFANNASGQPVLHFWLNVNNTTPTIRLYLTNSDSYYLRLKNLSPEKYKEVFGEDGKQWALIAVRLKDLGPAVTDAKIATDSYARMNFLIDSQQNVPIEVNIDWISITDKVLTGIGAVDMTDSF
ncbi:IPT/TIG domain-containing protein [Pontibacter sp. JH31]|uniref:IPT/TIG domain-containing protein n=1 Tax=Pontibacter aquaedesilientis TaxID=2766980 RepID=A0ABR7XBW2_9BACT|nr:IPT/TIG domain-containing protein [Pontibacter aquaedesilientis]MBD1395796.1 IPT/TIG domain-containing protein [Pontibacter aquaedesilientis]